MMYLVENAEQLKSDVWSGKIAPRYLDHLADGFTPMAPYSVVAAPLKMQGSQLAFSPDEAHLLCQGVSEDALFFNTDKVPEYSGTRGLQVNEQRGNTDVAFVQACETLVGEEFAVLAKSLVDGIRRVHAGRLVEKKGRKWLNQPENFVAITIQNRDRSLAVSIRNVLEAQSSSLHPKADRPGYLRFKVANAPDIPEALRLISASARR